MEMTVSATRRAVHTALREEDAALLSGLRLGATATVEALFDRYHGKVVGLAMSILKNKSDAEEAAQVLGLTIATVKSRLHRARLYLRERLSRYLWEGRVV